MSVSEIPIMAAVEMLHVAIEKIKVGAAAMKIGVHVVLLRAGRQLAVVKEIHNARGMRDGSKPNRAVVFTGFIDILVHAIMKEVVPIASPRI